MSQRPPDNLPYCNCPKHAQIPIPTRQDNSGMDPHHSTPFRPEELNSEPTMNADSQTSRHLLNLFSTVTELQHEVHELRRENRALAAQHAEDTNSLRQDNNALANLILKTNKETREYIKRHGYTIRGLSRVVNPVVVPDPAATATTAPVNQPRRNKKKTTTTNPTVLPNRELINLGISDINSSDNNERHLRSGREVPSAASSPPAPVTPVPLVDPNNSNMNNSATTINNEEEGENCVVAENLFENEESTKRPNDEEDENTDIKSSKKRTYQRKR